MEQGLVTPLQSEASKYTIVRNLMDTMYAHLQEMSMKGEIDRYTLQSDIDTLQMIDLPSGLKTEVKHLTDYLSTLLDSCTVVNSKEFISETENILKDVGQYLYPIKDTPKLKDCLHDATYLANTYSNYVISGNIDSKWGGPKEILTQLKGLVQEAIEQFAPNDPPDALGRLLETVDQLLQSKASGTIYDIQEILQDLAPGNT